MKTNVTEWGRGVIHLKMGGQKTRDHTAEHTGTQNLHGSVPACLLLLILQIDTDFFSVKHNPLRASEGSVFKMKKNMEEMATLEKCTSSKQLLQPCTELSIKETRD